MGLPVGVAPAFVTQRANNKMKTLLILALISICAFSLYSKDIVDGLGLVSDAQSAKPAALGNLARNNGKQDNKQRPMTAQELTELAKKDPDASRKFLQSHEAPEERNDSDKLINLFSRGKYE